MKKFYLLLFISGSVLFSNAQNVGIGTSSPNYKLDVAGDVNLSDKLRLNGLATPNKVLKTDANGNPFWGDDENTTYTVGPGLTLTGTTLSHAPHTGDATGATTLTVVGLQNRPLSATVPTSGQVLKWNGTAWAPASDENTTYTAGSGISISSGTITNTSPSLWTLSGSNLYPNYNSWNAGVGTTAPAYKLDVAGSAGFNSILKIGPGSNNPERGPWNPIWTAIGAGKPIYPDEEFASGGNSVLVYNNSGGTGVQHFWENGDGSQPNSTGKWIRIENNGGTTSPGFGGFYQRIDSRRNATFVQRFRAKLPVGYQFVLAQNSQGTNHTSYWLTSTEGTGKWEEYIRVSHCGNTGTFSTGGHVYVTGPSNVFTWYLASSNIYEVNTPSSGWNNNEYIKNQFASAQSPANFWISGKGRIGDELSVIGNSIFGSNGTPATRMQLHHTSSGGMTGNVAYGGIHLKQDAGNDGYTGITSTATSLGTQGGILFQGSGSYGTKIHFLTTSSYAAGMQQRMIVDHLGNVGIGTTAPAERLHVSGGNIRVGGDYTLNSEGDHLKMMYGVRADDTAYEWVGFYSNTTRQGIILYDGAWSGANSRTDEFSITAENANMLTLNTQSGRHIALMPKGTGNVGINTLSPGEKLDVFGNVRASGIVYWGNGLVRTETRADAGLRGDAGAKSGFFETSAPSPASSWPTGASSWWHLLDVRHSNNGNNYAMQFAGSFFDQNLYYRKTNNNPAQPWTKLSTVQVFSATGSTDISMNSTTWTNTGLSLTFVPQSSTALVHLTMSGRSNPSAYPVQNVFCRVLLNGVSIGGAATPGEDTDGSATVTTWSMSFSKPVNVTPGTSYTLEVQWMRSGIYTTTIYNEPATSEIQHRTLTVTNY